MQKKCFWLICLFTTIGMIGCSLEDVQTHGEQCRDSSGNLLPISYIVNRTTSEICWANSEDGCYADAFTRSICPVENQKCRVDWNGEHYCLESCDNGQIACNGKCVTPNSNDYCGAKGECTDEDRTDNFRGTKCADNEKCIEGNCVVISSLICNSPEIKCTIGGIEKCVNIETDADHCGDCNTPCRKLTNGFAECKDKSCIYSCKEGSTKCYEDNNVVCLSNEDMLGNALHCGSCDIACAETEYCDNGKCEVSKCDKTVCYWKETDECSNVKEHCGRLCKDCNSLEHAASGECLDEQGVCSASVCESGYHLVTENGIHSCEINSDDKCGKPDSDEIVNCTEKSSKCSQTGECLANESVFNCGGIDCTAQEGWAAGGCVMGQCVSTTCQDGYFIQSNICISDNVENCGDAHLNCNLEISDVETASCEQAQCIAKTCKEGFHVYNQRCEKDSPDNCGEHGNVCDKTAYNATSMLCVDKKCVVEYCNMGFGICAGTGVCEAFTRAECCGMSNTICPENATCVAQSMMYSCVCKEGYHTYESGCEADNIDHCGKHDNRCEFVNSKEVTCNKGKCAIKSCHDNYTQCGSSCVNLKTDDANCNSCGNKCGTDQTCQNGTCDCKTEGQTLCSDGQCHNLNSDNANCGECGIVCTNSKTCINGSCQCPNNTTLCPDGQCHNLNSETSNCGACGKACTRLLQICNNGSCQCPEAYADCPNTSFCTKIYDDSNNCGGCGKKCKDALGSGYSCQSGQCCNSTECCNIPDIGNAIVCQKI